MLIGIDPGHGGTNTGTRHNGIVEEEYTLRVALALEKALHAKHWECVLSRREDESVSFEMRAERLAHADVVVVLHVNAAGTEDPHGMRCYAKVHDLAAKRLGEALLAHAPAGLRQDCFEVSPATPYSATERCYNVLARYEDKPAVLCEMFFATNRLDAIFANRRDTPALLAECVMSALAAFTEAPVHHENAVEFATEQ